MRDRGSEDPSTNCESFTFTIYMCIYSGESGKLL